MKPPGSGRFPALVRVNLESALNQPITLLLTLLASVCTTVVPLIQLTTFGEAGKLARDGGMAFLFLFGAILVTHLGTASVRRDIEQDLLSTFLIKTVRPVEVVAAAFTGVTLALLIFSIPVATATLLAIRVSECYEPIIERNLLDYRVGSWMLVLPILCCLLAALLNRARRFDFVPAALWALVLGSLVTLVATSSLNRVGAWRLWCALPDPSPLAGIVLILLALVIIAAFGVSLSTVFRPGVSSLLVLAIVSLAFLQQAWTGGGPFAQACSSLLPDLNCFWLPDALDAGGQIPPAYLGMALAYATLYSGAIVLLGVAGLTLREQNR